MTRAVFAAFLSTWIGSITCGFIAAALLCAPTMTFYQALGFEGSVGASLVALVATILTVIIGASLLTLGFVATMEAWLYRSGRLPQVFRVVRPGNSSTYCLEHLNFVTGWEVAWPSRCWNSATEACDFLDHACSCNEVNWEAGRRAYDRKNTMIVGPVMTAPVTVVRRRGQSDLPQVA